MSKAAIAAIDALKPYRGGDDLLWQLHRLENVDKHRVLIDCLFPLKSGMELFVDVPNAEPNSDVQFRFDVAFGETDIVSGAALIDRLQAMLSRVEQLLAQFAPML